MLIGLEHQSDATRPRPRSRSPRTSPASRASSSATCLPRARADMLRRSKGGDRPGGVFSMKRNLTIAVASIALAVPAIAVGQRGAHAVYEGHLIGVARLVREAEGVVRRPRARGEDVRGARLHGRVRGRRPRRRSARTKLVGTIPVDKDGDFKRQQRQRPHRRSRSAATSAATRRPAGSATSGSVEGRERPDARLRQRQARAWKARP